MGDSPQIIFPRLTAKTIEEYSGMGFIMQIMTIIKLVDLRGKVYSGLVI